MSRGLADQAPFTIPRAITAGWHSGTERWPEGRFIRYAITDARYR